MKKILLVLILLISPGRVLANVDEKAKDIYLENVEIDGLEFTPKYDKYQNVYTIISNDYQMELEIDVSKEKESDNVSIVGNNNLSYGENKIDIVVYDEEYSKENIYTIYVNFLEIVENEAVFEEIIDSGNNYIGIEQVSGIVFGCYSILMIVFKIMFFPNKKKN